MIMNRLKYGMPRKLKGASMIEYILGLAILTTAIAFVEVGDTGLTAIELLEQALKKESSAYSESISRPR